MCGRYTLFTSAEKLAERFGYPRLSCQIEVEQDLRVELVEKVVWGSRQPDALR